LERMSGGEIGRRVSVIYIKEEKKKERKIPGGKKEIVVSTGTG
jgi:hypothetical protein